MRIAIGLMMQETNTFASTPTDMDVFRAGYVRYGESILDFYRNMRVEVSGFLSVLDAAGVTPVPLLGAHAYSGGPVTRAAFDELVGEFTSRIREGGPIDGVLLALHGAMVVEDEPDAEGRLLEAIRNVVGPNVPIAASLDLHGHITPLMIEQADILIGYREYPHIDMFETGERTAQLLLDTLAGRLKPVLALAKRHMILSPVNARTTDEPLSRVVAAVREMERQGRIVAGSLFPVQPWIDVPDLGFAALTLAENAASAQAAADELVEMVWQLRHQFEPDIVPLPEAIRIGLSAPSGTTVVGDAGDAPSSGAVADNNAVLRALLEAGADKANGRLSFLTLRDPEAVQQAAAAGIGATVTLSVGHKLSPRDGSPITITGRVTTLTEGLYRMHGPGGTGTLMNMGPSAVIAIGDIRLVLKTYASMEWDPAVFTSMGLAFVEAALVFVKSPGHFRAAYSPLAERVLVADTPGAARANMRALELHKVTRPLFPLDDV